MTTPKPKILSTEYKKIEAEIKIIQDKIDQINPIIAVEKGLVDEDDRLIGVYTTKLNELKEKLKKVTNTHQSVYDSVSGKIADLQASIASCNNPNANESLNPNKQNSLNRLNNITTVEIPAIEKIYMDLGTIISKFDASFNEYDSDIIIFYQPQITGFKTQIGIIKEAISALIIAKEANQTKINILNEEIRDLNKQINDLIIKDYSNKVHNNKNVLNLSEYIDTSLNYLFSYLKDQSLSSDVIYEKIEHRDNEHDKLSASNKVFDIIFYCFYFSFFLIMICTGNIKRDHFLIYLFVGLIPFIYPFIFKFVMYLIKYISNDPHGPKNAFVDINNTIIAYND